METRPQGWVLYDATCGICARSGLRRVFDAGYRPFADNRHRLSRACGLGPLSDRTA